MKPSTPFLNRLPRLSRVLGRTAVVIVLLLTMLAVSLYLLVRASVPILDGEQNLSKLAAPALINRDRSGMVTIRADDFSDAARALGFVHAQERFFEMDLARRAASGELSALLGSVTVNIDKEKRRHRLRARLTEVWQSLPSDQQDLLQHYTDGVNAGLTAFTVRPWQYLLMRTEPTPWTPVDSLLVVGEMYAMLQGRSGEARFADAMLRSQIGDALFDWLSPRGGHWDAPLDGSVIQPARLPSAAELNLRKTEPVVQHAATSQQTTATLESAIDPELHAGSNSWAVGGALTAHGGAMLANDMHLGLGVPNIWFRTQMMIGKDGKNIRRLVGVSLPGVPGLTVGSNGDIAWGFTNSTGKWFDWVPLTADEKITEIEETVAVKGSDPVKVMVRESRYGPVLREATIAGKKQSFAYSWVLYQPGAVNLSMAKILTIDNIDEALQLAHVAGIPHQNVIVVDASGNLGWTIAGRFQNYPDWAHHADRGRFTAADKLPLGWLAGDQVPLIKNPASSRIATANNRLLGGQDGEKIGDGGFDPGARGGQITARLNEKQQFIEADLFAIQRDNESLFLKRWATLLSQVATNSKNPAQRAVLDVMAGWNGRADVDQVGHRLARAYRQAVVDSLWQAWIKAAGAQPLVESITVKQNNFPSWDGRAEYPVWQAITSQPMHLLPLPYESWQAFLSAQLDRVTAELSQQQELSKATWGERNRAKIQHPFARAIPSLGRWLNMPADPLPGDNNMPLVASPTFGASERMVVAPGREESGIFNMPGGQSGHPLSPFYASGHNDWVKGKMGPLLAGPPIHTLVLKP